MKRRDYLGGNYFHFLLFLNDGVKFGGKIIDTKSAYGSDTVPVGKYVNIRGILRFTGKITM